MVVKVRLINIVSTLQDRLAGSAFALAIQSLLVFGSLTLFLCSPCLSLIFFGYYLGYCPTGAVDRSKGGGGGGVGVGGGGGDEKEVVAQQIMVVEKRSKRGESRELLTRSGKSKKRKRKALKISEAQAQVLGEWFTFEFCILFLNLEIKSSPSQSTDAAAAAAPSHCFIGRLGKVTTGVKDGRR